MNDGNNNNAATVLNWAVNTIKDKYSNAGLNVPRKVAKLNLDSGKIRTLKKIARQAKKTYTLQRRIDKMIDTVNSTGGGKRRKSKWNMAVKKAFKIAKSRNRKRKFTPAQTQAIIRKAASRYKRKGGKRKYKKRAGNLSFG